MPISQQVLPIHLAATVNKIQIVALAHALKTHVNLLAEESLD